MFIDEISFFYKTSSISSNLSNSSLKITLRFVSFHRDPRRRSHKTSYVAHFISQFPSAIKNNGRSSPLLTSHPNYPNYRLYIYPECFHVVRQATFRDKGTLDPWIYQERI